MHLAGLADQDFKDVSRLVNSSGGDWGYVTLVIPDNDRDHNKWQEIFDKLRRVHLIPIVRIATHADGPVWHRPAKEDALGWADFLNSLNWVTKDRYVIIFNEPNHGQEWGGSVDAKDYARTSYFFAKTLKEKNPDFLPMLAGIDAAAPSSLPNYQDEEVFLRQMKEEIPNIFDVIDGWSSHSYPNPGFSASPYANGRNSIHNYIYELDLLKNMGVKKELPVFITETGWIHAEGNVYQSGNLTADQVAQNYKILFDDLIKDKRIQAITPFVFDYQGEPFSHFSFKKMNSPDFYPQFSVIKDFPKIKGEPLQRQKISVHSTLPKILLQDSTYKFQIVLKNEGQAILDKRDGYQLKLDGDISDFIYFFSDFHELEPQKTATVDFYLKTKDDLNHHAITISLYKNDNRLLGLFDYSIDIKPLPDVSFKVSAFPKLSTNGKDFEIQIFDTHEGLVYKQSDLTVKKGKGIVKSIQNIALNEKYRVVVLRPYYLPRQKVIAFKEINNTISFDPMIPIDFNFDGQFTLGDFMALVKNPRLVKNLFP
jgi:hypothetical protein